MTAEGYGLRAQGPSPGTAAPQGQAPRRETGYVFEPTGVFCTPTEVRECQQWTVGILGFAGLDETPADRLNRLAIGKGLEDRRPAQGFALFSDTGEIAYYAEARPAPARSRSTVVAGRRA